MSFSFGRGQRVESFSPKMKLRRGPEAHSRPEADNIDLSFIED